MPKFVVAPHFRLQEWVAEEKGYFAAEGLDYEFREALDSSSGSGHQLGNKVGAYQTLEAGRSCNVSAACHWTMNVAASNGHGKLYAECYSVSPCGIFVPPNSPVKTPADLAGVPISVGYQSGSHYATIQGLEQYLKPEQIALSFEAAVGDGSRWGIKITYIPRPRHWVGPRGLTAKDFLGDRRFHDVPRRQPDQIERRRPRHRIPKPPPGGHDPPHAPCRTLPTSA